MAADNKDQTKFVAWRFYLMLAFITLVVLGLVYRLFDLTILNQRFLRHQGDERALRLVSTPAFRGIIADRNGFPLAVSTTVYSIWMNPKEFVLSNDAIASLSHLLNLNSKELIHLYKRVQKNKREFVYLKRSQSPEVAAKIKALHLTGIYLQEEYRRYYPEGEASAHVLGFTNIDDHGQEGIELAYNDWLAGVAGKKWALKDRLGRVINDVQTVSEQKPGHDLILSIDRRIQYLAYRELLIGTRENDAKSASAIVLDVNTGEILAMANVPSFNPNNRKGYRADVFRNRAITDIFEPGSTIKAFTVASALESGLFTADSVIDTRPGWMRVGHNIVRDEHSSGLFSITQILQKSSNMGAAKMVLRMPPNQLWSLLHRVGFGEATGIGFPGEQSGVLIKHDPWGAFMLATLSFGYGMSTTPLQLARAYSVFAANGQLKPLSLLKVEQAPAGIQVLKPALAHQMLALLESVVMKGGTAVAAHVPGYRVAGKTGTARMVGAGGYEKHHHTGSFVGIAPLNKPRLLVIVVINDPAGKKYMGGDISAPVFKRIMEGSLRILDVPPDAIV